jgi:hypothetical protein
MLVYELMSIPTISFLLGDPMRNWKAEADLQSEDSPLG